MKYNLKEFYTVAEAASILAVSEKSVRDFINAGELKAIKVGQWRISVQAIGEFMEARSNHYKAKARGEVLEVLNSTDVMQAGAPGTLLIRDYPASNADVHGPFMSSLIQQLPQGSNIQWRFFFEPELNRARHIFTGDLWLITKLLRELEQELEVV